MGLMRRIFDRRLLTSLVVVGTTLSMTACSHKSAAAPAPHASTTAAGSPASLTITPDNGTQGLPVSTEIGVKVGNGTVDSVKLVKSGTTDSLPGAMRPDGTSWVPNAPLDNGASYQATVTAKGPAGKPVSQTTSFTTANSSGSEIGTGLYLQDGETVGVAMPIVVQFDTNVPDSARADVQKRLFVTTDPPQPGVWSWASGQQVYYRPPTYWKPGTKITVRAALQGVPIGNSFGDTDRSATVTVGQKVFMYVDNASKSMSVYLNDQLVRTMPVSLGKPDTPSSSGFMVTMSHDPTTTFNTLGIPGENYLVNVNWAERLTWGGEFIHAAPWSVAQQGNTNVSHGCVNMSDGNSKWLFDQENDAGDPVIVKGTEVQLQYGNGFTAWNIPWSQYVSMSALPVSPDLANAPAVDPVTGIPPQAPAPTSSPSSSSPTKPPAQPAAQPTHT
jgi:lipoprotein-anchoring transpeptidase ErfK/SrfK